MQGEGNHPPLRWSEGGTERAERSGGLHKRSAEDCGKPLVRARSSAHQEGLVTSLRGAERVKTPRP